MRARLGGLGMAATVAAASLLIGASASASHSNAATYTGSVEGGGSVGFDVSGDGRAITTILLNVPTTECGAFLFQLTGTVPIVDHAFRYADSTLTFGGSFPTPQTAEGTIQIPACTSSPRHWSATTPAQPPPRPTPTPTPPDRAAPLIALSGHTTQRARRTVKVSVTSNESGAATAGGAVIVRRTRRIATRFTLRSAVTQLAANVTSRLKLRVPRRARKAITNALRKRKRVRAVLTVSVRDTAGNLAVVNRTVRLRRP